MPVSNITAARCGFSLIELMVVVALVGILIAAGILSLTTVQRNARNAKRIADVDAIAKALETYIVTTQTYSLATTYPCLRNGDWRFEHSAWGAVGFRTGCPSSVGNALQSYFPSGIPRDPFCTSTTSADTTGTCANSWTDYNIRSSAGITFVIYVKLENPTPAQTCPSAPAPWNYCVFQRQ